MKKIIYFLALSRTPHGLLDMATPALAALLWYGSIPPFEITLLGLVTAFAGYTAVYALNDLVDYRLDRKKIEQGVLADTGDDLDARLVRHPLARGFLTVREATLWASGWALLALIGAFLLNPLCVLVFVGACILETIYCLLWSASPFRTLVSGAVKTAGGIAAVLAVDPHPSLIFLLVLFLWLFFWEIGGQNIPNDLSDLEEDRLFQAKTIPVRFGAAWTHSIIFWSLVLAVALSGILLGVSRLGGGFASLAASLGAGVYLLILPGYRLFKAEERSQALVLFNRASYYPLALLMVNSLSLVI